jgi:mono/diheme cytochrome c family protein/cytochrome c2
MRLWLVLGSLVLAAAATSAIVLYSGVYSVAATKQHFRPVHWLLETGMRQSVRRHARDIMVPPLADSARVSRGRVLHDEHCVRCHGAPGIAPEPFALGLMPLPSNLAYTAREWPPAELFWVIKHGIRMAGMPAWDTRIDDSAVWAIVAYLQVLPGQSPREYRTSAPTPVPADLRSPEKPASRTANVERGRIAIERYACATCHVIPGIVGATASVGPPLTRIASRSFIAGFIPNSVDNMAAWLEAPSVFLPESAMPDLGVTGDDARDMAAYLHAQR